MNDFTTEIVQTLVTKGDLNELFRSHLEKAIGKEDFLFLCWIDSEFVCFQLFHKVHLLSIYDCFLDFGYTS